MIKLIKMGEKGKMLVDIINHGIEACHQLQKGDMFVYIDKSNEILKWDSKSISEERIAKVLWHYDVDNADRYIGEFEGDYEIFKKLNNYVKYKETLKTIRSVWKTQGNIINQPQ